MSDTIKNQPFKFTLEDFSRMMGIEISEVPRLLPLEEDPESALRTILAPLETLSSMILDLVGKSTDERTVEIHFLMQLGIVIQNTIRQIRYVCLQMKMG